MIKVFLFLFAGILTGVLLRGKKRMISFFEKAALGCVFLLLFLFGAEAGLNDKVTQTFLTTGINGIVLAVGSVMGSILLSVPVYFFIFRKKEDS
jgi:hypothetical protein